MQPFRKIFVATDFSETSLEALREADAVALRSGAELFVFHSVPNLVRANPLFPHKNIEDAFDLPALMERAADAVADVVTRRTSRSADDVHIVIDTGSADATLLRQAEAVGADLIVLGSRGYTGLRHVLMGSVAERVLRYAPCAVLVARASPESGTVLAATDFSDPALPAIQAAAGIAKSRGATLTVMHSLGVASNAVAAAAIPLGGGPIVPGREAVAAARKAAIELIEESLRKLGLDGSVIVAQGLPEDELVKVASTLPAQLVVMGSLGRTGLARIALGSVAETVARTAPCSVLVIRQ
jgi:nucleotide-binding universal stress UspA family protein